MVIIKVWKSSWFLLMEYLKETDDIYVFRSVITVQDVTGIYYAITFRMCMKLGGD